MAFVRSGNGGGDTDVLSWFEDTSHNFIEGASATARTLTVESGKHYLLYLVNTNTSGNAFPTKPTVDSGADVIRTYIDGTNSGVRSRITIVLVEATSTTITIAPSSLSGRICAVQLD